MTQELPRSYRENKLSIDALPHSNDNQLLDSYQIIHIYMNLIWIR